MGKWGGLSWEMGHNWVRYTSQKHIHPIDLRSRINNPVSVSSYRWPFYNSPNWINYLDEVFVRGLSTIGDKMSWGTSPKTGLFSLFTNFRRRKYSFSSPIPSLSVVPIFVLPTGTNKHPNWNGGGRVGAQILLFSEVTLFECNASTILSPIVGISLRGDCERITWK